MEAHWSQRSAIPAKLLLAHLRPDLSAAQQQPLLNNHAAYRGLSLCSFGRRGPPASAVRREADGRSEADGSMQDRAYVYACDVLLLACDPVPQGGALAAITALHPLPPQRTGRRHFGSPGQSDIGQSIAGHPGARKTHGD